MLRLVFLLTLVITATGRAQEVFATLDSGAAVRVSATGRAPEVGHLAASWSPQSPVLYLCTSITVRCANRNDTLVHWIDGQRIREVLVARGTQWRRGLINGGASGLALGVTVAALLAHGQCSDCSRRPMSSLWLISASTVGFALLGTGIGALHPHWTGVRSD
jgi:tetrahydromethanopterin S-methyltransferase subunit F